jgi:hypothetical protein
MISAAAGPCRHCGFALSAEHVLQAARDQEVVEGAIRQATNLKYAGWTALVFGGLELYFCLLASELPIYFLAIQVAPPIGLFTGLNWIRKYGALQTDEGDYPEAKRAMHRTTMMWVGVFVLQFLLLVALGVRIYLTTRHAGRR